MYLLDLPPKYVTLSTKLKKANVESSDPSKYVEIAYGLFFASSNLGELN